MERACKEAQRGGIKGEREIFLVPQPEPYGLVLPSGAHSAKWQVRQLTKPRGVTHNPGAVPFWLTQPLTEPVRLGLHDSSFLSPSCSVSKIGMMIKNGERVTFQDSGETAEVQSTTAGLLPVAARPGVSSQVFQRLSRRWKSECRQFTRECSQDQHL